MPHSIHISSERIHSFQEMILLWHQTNQRKFPWRKNSISNYQKAISEVLLQRTRAETIKKFWDSLFTKFPSWESISKTELYEIEDTLKPIGLYRQRAKRLLSLAKEMTKRGGRFPKNKEDLEKIPMIGQYIAFAILTVIFNRPYPLLDVNMTRLLERFFGKRILSDIRYDPYLQELAMRVVNIENPKIINWAILDFSSIVCTSKKPNCDVCILSSKCTYYLKGKTPN